MGSRVSQKTSDRGSLEISIAFHDCEAVMWRNGGVAGFLVMLADTATNNLGNAGAFLPYEFSCRGGDGNLLPRLFVGKEL